MPARGLGSHTRQAPSRCAALAPYRTALALRLRNTRARNDFSAQARHTHDHELRGNQDCTWKRWRVSDSPRAGPIGPA